ncbi:MAG: hypothetical protein ABSG97_05515 [Sedimentisphaerales bacterium]
MDIINVTLKYLYELGLYLDYFGRSLAPWATIAGVTVIGYWIATLRNQKLEKRMEMIKKIYGTFGEGDLFKFYDRIRSKDSINWKNSEDEELLNRSLTIFDEINFLQTQKSFDDKAWEYIASEIQYFALREEVWDYMVKRIQEGLDNGFPIDIIPFTGFPDLLKNIPPKFKAKNFKGIPEKHKEFYKKLGYFES